ncbi:MAG: hypothetical protein IH623_09290 [Verrucomicrobia bacterium]|nr:hypothetical protein [Verrucomicrobiota bacterium]
MTYLALTPQHPLRLDRGENSPNQSSRLEPLNRDWSVGLPTRRVGRQTQVHAGSETGAPVHGEGWVRCRILAVIGAAHGIFESILRWKSVKGGAGDSPAPVGDPPNGIPSPHRMGRLEPLGKRQKEFGKQRPARAERTGVSESMWRSRMRCPRPETRVCEIENHELPTLLKMVFDQMQNGMN